jgi:hypothetical protein
LNNTELLVLNSKKELHLWSLETFQIKTKYDVKENVYNITPIAGKFIFLETNDKYLLLECNTNISVKEEIEKKVNTKAFILNAEDGYKLFILDDKENIEVINKKL